MATKKVKSAGRFGVRYGRKIRQRVVDVEIKQRKKQLCPYCHRVNVKRVAMGIWHCKTCDKKFAGGAYYL